MNKKLLISIGILIASIMVFCVLSIISNHNNQKQNNDLNYKKELNSMISDAKIKVISDKSLINSDIYEQVEKGNSINGVIYVNENYEVAFAIEYNDTCYIKKFGNEEFEEIKNENCISNFKENINLKEEIVDENKQYNYEDENFDENKLESKLYLKYIKFSDYNINAYKNINLNDDNSNEYLVMFAIQNILKQNNVDIEKYTFADIGNWTNEETYSEGYKITTEEIEKVIKDNFNVTKNIDYKSLDLTFKENIKCHYYEKENFYRLIDSNSIPASGFTSDIYSKFINSEQNGDNIIIYTEYIEILDWRYVRGYVEKLINIENITLPETIILDEGKTIIDYVLENYKSEIGEFKHTFKKSNGDYYWFSTEKIN